MIIKNKNRLIFLSFNFETFDKTDLYKIEIASLPTFFIETVNHDNNNFHFVHSNERSNCPRVIAAKISSVGNCLGLCPSLRKLQRFRC